jgi:hypothetical protein
MLATRIGLIMAGSILASLPCFAQGASPDYNTGYQGDGLAQFNDGYRGGGYTQYTADNLNDSSYSYRGSSPLTTASRTNPEPADSVIKSAAIQQKP